MTLDIKKIFKSSLGLQLSVIFTLLVAVGIGIVSNLILRSEREVLKTTLVQSGRDIVKNISGNVADALSQAPVDDTALISIIKNSMKNKYVKYVQITDPGDSLIISSDRVMEELGKRYLAPALIFSDIEPYWVTREGEKIYDIKLPVKAQQDKEVGNVHLGLSNKSIDEVIGKVTRQVFLIAFAIILLGIVFSVVLSNFIVRPIKQLIDGVTKITAGNYDTQIDMKLHNELDDLTKSFNDMTKSLKEKELIKNAFSRYMSTDLLNEVIKEKGNLQLGGEKRMVTILFSDIRDFTTMAENLDPQEVVKLLNEYFTRMTEIIFTNKGVVNKYMGDAIMALYGAPIAHKDHAEKAVKTALDMYSELNKLKVKWQKEGRPIIGMKIGITTGEVVIGNVGSTEHMEYTVIGDAVNVAARLQGMNKNYGTQILISDNTYELIKDYFETKKLDLVQFKGKTAFTLIYEVLGYKKR